MDRGGFAVETLKTTKWVKLRRTQYEHMLSALPSNSDIARRSRHFAFVPIAEVADLQPTSRGTTSSMAQGKAQSPQRQSRVYSTKRKSKSDAQVRRKGKSESKIPRQRICVRIDRENRIQDQGG